MGCSNLEIVFDRGDVIYTSGELLTGKVLATFTKPVEVRAVRLTVVGESRVKWTQKTNKHHVTYTGYESYFSSEFYLLGDGSNSNITLPVGNLEYLFNVQLPIELPNSFEHKYGYIKYTVKVTFDRPWKMDDELEVPFYIASPLDLNSELEASREIIDEVEENFCCFCVSKGTISVSIFIPSSGFVPGQTIPVTLRCVNDSNVEVTRIECSLRQRLAFHAESLMSRRTKDIEECAMKEMYFEPFPNNSKDPVSLQLKVPALPASSLRNCRIIDLEYALKIKIVFSGWRCSLDRYFPVFIGTVPLINSRDIYNSNNVTAPHPTAPLLSETFSPTSPEFTDTPQLSDMPQPLPIGFVTTSLEPSFGNSADLPPPSYEESTHNAAGVSGESKTDQSTRGAQIPSVLPARVYSHEPANELPTGTKDEKS